MKVEDLKVNQLIEIKVAIDEGFEYYASRIEEIGDKYLFISMPIRKGEYIPMHIGEEILIVIYHKTGTFGFFTQIVGRKWEQIPLLIINKPDRLSSSVNQKREYVRLKVALPLRYQIVDNEEGSEAEEGITVDLSAGGLLFYTRGELKADQKLIIELQFNPQEIFFAKAHVVRVFERSKHENAMRVAIEFDDITEGQRDRIFKFIFEKQREWARKGILR